MLGVELDAELTSPASRAGGDLAIKRKKGRNESGLFWDAAAKQQSYLAGRDGVVVDGDVAAADLRLDAQFHAGHVLVAGRPGLTVHVLAGRDVVDDCGQVDLTDHRQLGRDEGDHLPA